MSDVTRNYGIIYTADTERAKAGISGLAAAVFTLDQRARDSTNELGAMVRQVDQATPKVQGLARAMTALATVDLSRLRGLGSVIGEIGDGLTFARQESANLKGGLDGLAGSNRPLGGVAATVGRIGDNAMRAARNIGDVGVAASTAGARKGDLDGLAAGVEKVQRKGYGAKKNIEELNAALAAVGSNAAGLNAAATAAGQLATNAKAGRTMLRGTAAATRSVGRGLLQVAAGITAVEVARKVASAAGDAVNDARALTVKGAERAIVLRDTYREVANLQGKAAPDDETVATGMRLRMSSGMTDSDADKFLRRWYGSLPAGRDKGNIDDRTAGDLQGVAGALGVRTGMDAGTAGDLAASLANYGKVPNARAAAGQLGVIVDRLNEGRGDLTPLTNALLKTAGTTVGPKGSAFADLGELASVLGVFSNNASPSAAGTMIQQTMRGLSYSGKKSDELLKQAGIGGGDDFAERVRKITPFIREAENKGINPMDMLRDAGFGNVTDRRGIVYSARNNQLIQDRVGSTRASRGADGYAGAGAEVEALNRDFLVSDVSRDRIAAAALDASEYARYAPGAMQQTERRLAETRLRSAGKIDTPGWNLFDRAADGFGLFTMLGAQPEREARIDREAVRPEERRPGPGRRRGGRRRPDQSAPRDAGRPDEAGQRPAGAAGRNPLPFKPRVDPIR